MAKQDAVTAQTIATERATKALGVAQTSLDKTVTGLVATLGKEVELATGNLNTLTEQVQDKQAQLASLEQEHARQADDAAYQLKIKVRDNEQQTLRELLRKNDLAEVKTSELANLTREVEALKADNSEDLQAAVNDAVERAEDKSARVLVDLKADHKVALAQHTAQAQSDATTIKLLTAQLEQARKDLDAEREARVAIEEHRSNASGVVVNTSK